MVSGVTEFLFGVGGSKGGPTRPSSGGWIRTASQGRMHNQKSNGGGGMV